MNTDEEKAMAILQKNRQIHVAAVSDQRGTLIKELGDGMIVSFDSVSAAVECGIKIIIESEGFEVKIGINHGEVTFEDDDIFGDPVNVAARIESIGSGNSILLSGLANAMLANNNAIRTEKLGEYLLKNIAEPVEIFAVSHKSLYQPDAEELKQKAVPVESGIFNNLPIVNSSFIGRDREIDEIRSLFVKSNLVTLYGPGGSGKTRLATELARRYLSDFRDGVYFVDLSSTTNENLVVGIIADILRVPEEAGVPRQESISKMISNKSCLVIIDNCEHLIDRCADLLDYLSKSATSAKLVATSREVLNIQNEQPYLVPTLSVSSEGSGDFQSEAVQLFTSRAKEIRNDFVLNKENGDVIIGICRKLDGIPLALELAASRINLMDTKTLLERLDKQFSILKTNDRSLDSRHKTIEATIDWSHQLLSEEEQVLFNRLSIFNGDFGLEEAEKICGFEPLEESDVLDLMSQLVNKSLLIPVHSEGSTIRYRLLELMKQYGARKIGEDHSAAAERMFVYFCELGTKSYYEKLERNQYWRQRLSLDEANIIGILNHLNGDVERTMVLGANFLWYWMERDLAHVAFEYMLPVIGDYKHKDSIKAKSLCTLGLMLARSDKVDLALDYVKEGMEIFESLEDNIEKADSALNSVLIYLWTGEFTLAKIGLDIALQISGKLQDTFMDTRVGMYNACYYLYQFNVDDAEPLINTGFELAKKNQSPWDIIIYSHIYADVPLVRKQYDEAEKRYQSSCRVCIDFGNQFQACIELQGVSMALSGQGRTEKSIKIWGGTLKKFEEIGMSPMSLPFWITLQKDTIVQRIEEIGKEKSEQLINQGRELTFDQLVEYALDSESM